MARRTALTASRSCIADDVTSAKYSFTREPFIPPKVVADLIIDHQALLNSWEDQRVVDAVKKTGRKQLVVAALWTEICLAMPVIQSLADGYDVFFVTDASGGVITEVASRR